MRKALVSRTALATLALVAFASSAHAAEWRDGGDKQYTGTPEEAARAYLTDQLDDVQLGTVELAHRNTLEVAGRYHTVRFTQHVGGVPVLGGATAVMVGPDGRVRAAAFDVARDLHVASAPALDRGHANTAVAHRRGMSHAKSNTSLAISRDDGGRLVWVVDVPTEDGGWRYLVDATDGRLLKERALASHAQGRVYSISSVNTPTPVDVELLDLTVETPQHLNGWSGNLTVTNYVSGDPNGQGAPLVLEQTVEPNSGEDFLYDPPADAGDATDAFAQVNLYHHLTRSRDFFRDELAVDSSGASWRLVAAANLQNSGQPFDNAFFSPMGMSGTFSAPNFIGIGQGSVDFSYDSDVFIHEFGHYVSHNAVGYNQGQLGTSEWGLSPWGGAIDEGISDYFACTINGDSTLGEASLANLGGARELTDTSKVCPDDVVGEVHFDGEIIGSLSWSIREELGAEVTDQLVWGAVSMLTSTTSLGNYARAIMTTAEAMVGDTLTAGDLTTIEGLIAERGLDECDQELPLEKDEPLTTQMIGLDLLGQAFGADCATVQAFGLELASYFHFRVTPDASDEAVRFAVDYGSVSGNLNWTIYVRRGEHVGMASPGGPVPIPVPSEYDYASEAFTTTSGEIVIDQYSDPPFDPSQTYHMVIGQQNCPNVTAVVSTNATPGEPPGEGGAGGEAGAGGSGNPNLGEPVEVGDGCGCEVAGADGEDSAAWLAVLLGIAALGRRRSRRV